ncbi:MAG: DUF4153 domain-containing protein [Gemmatimonadaceae bacterium]|nr:DUF4153 domain-containing protein [Gemmatimonadaceae bacterium]
MRMKFPSISVVVAAAGRSARRFPMVLLAAAVATFAALILTGEDADEQLWSPVLAVASLGLPLFFALTMLVEARALPVRWQVLLHGAAAAMLIAIAAVWPDWTDNSRPLRYAMFSTAFHLLAAYLCYAGVNAPNGFWQYNKALFLRFLTSGLYAVVLFAGLFAAIAAIDVLFKAELDSRIYAQLWSIVTFASGTWFFVSGVPEPLSALEERTDYPDGLRKFAQYLLIPLVVVYLLILTTYLGKVVLTREWPSGWIGYLVSFVTITGMLAWLLVRPLEDREEYAWVKRYTRGFYFALLPSIGMLWVALLKRFLQYGMTERRYIALAGALWLTGIALFYIISRSRSLKVIPSTLCVVALLLSAGPVGAFSVSRRDQTRRLERVLVRNGLLSDGLMVRSARAVSDSDVVAIGSGVWYLRNTHGVHALDRWLPDSVRRQLVSTDTGSRYNVIDRQATFVVATLGLPFRRGGAEPRDAGFFYRSGERTPIAVTGFDIVVPVSHWMRDSLPLDRGFVARFDTLSGTVIVTRGGAKVLTLATDSILRRASQLVAEDRMHIARPTREYRPPLVVDGSAAGIRARLAVSSIAGRGVAPNYRLSELNGHLLIAFETPP